MPETPDPLSLKPQDLSNMLKHAFMAGRLSNEHPVEMLDESWVKYDPTENAAYQRILSILMGFNESRTSSFQVDRECRREIEGDE